MLFCMIYNVSFEGRGVEVQSYRANRTVVS